VYVSTHNRRGILRLGIAGSALAFGSIQVATRSAEAQTTPWMRQNIADLDASHPILETYRAAIKYLNGLPSTDRRSLAYQVEIHRTRCPHGNWYLLPWHREFILSFEEIVRSLPISGASTFAIPYWNWTTSPTLPPMFRYPTMSDGVTPNPLYNSTRLIAPDTAIKAELVGKSRMDRIYNQTAFESFGSSRAAGQDSTSSTWQRQKGIYGMLESSPHNGVHSSIGGDMGTHYSPRDPLFWLHHSNIDRIWRSWNQQGNNNSNESYWNDFVFSNNFARPNGALYSIAVRDISAASYVYDSLDPKPGTTSQASMFLPESEWFQVAAVGNVSPPSQPKERFVVANQKSVALGQVLSIRVDLEGKGPSLPPRAVLQLTGVEAPPVDDPPMIRVFVNHPSIGPRSPIDSPYYVGTVAFFGTASQHQHVHGVGGDSRFSFELPLAETLANLKKAGKWPSDSLNVQIVPVEVRPLSQQIRIMPAAVSVIFF
jgi:tyrosinase